MPGGKRPGSGRKPKELTKQFREFCRKLTADPEILATLEARAKQDPVFCLKLLEYGIGRPFQAVYVGGSIDHQHAVREVQLDDGNVAFAEVTSLPAAGIN